MIHLPEPWYQHATLYHIYPLSFGDANGDGFGDLRGIIDRLDYLNDGTAQSLGVTAIWLSPVYVSPMADWGYDVADYYAIDPRFGSMKDFEALLAQVHRRGMKLLMDYVPNHTSILHPWFLSSRSSRTNPKRDWYIWADPAPGGGVPNNWLSNFGGSAWQYDETTGQYYLHSFLTEQADLNWRNPHVREAMLDVLRFWLKKGVDGFRTDAVFGLIKDEKLRDDIPNPEFVEGTSDPAERYLRVHSAGQHQLNEVIGSFCEVLSHSKDTYLLSEAYLNIPGMHQLYQACQDHPLHAPFNFNLMKLEWDAKIFRSFIDEYEAMLGSDDWPNYVLGNHDRHRLATRVGKKQARLLGFLQLTLRGLPVVYYGDELGLTDTVVSKRHIRDTWELRTPGYDLGRDPGRAPMPWTSDKGAGFTEGIPWLPFNRELGSVNVAVQQVDPESSLQMYRHLIHLRQASLALQTGRYRSVAVSHPQVYAYVRETRLQRFVAVLNFDSKPADVVVDAELGQWVAGTHLTEGDGDAPVGSRIRLGAYEGRLYESRGKAQ